MLRRRKVLVSGPYQPGTGCHYKSNLKEFNIFAVILIFNFSVNSSKNKVSNCEVSWEHTYETRCISRKFI